MLKKKTERLIPQSDQPKKQVSRGKVTVPKNSKQNALSTEKNSHENRKTAKKPTSGKKNSAGQKKQNPHPDADIPPPEPRPGSAYRC